MTYPLDSFSPEFWAKDDYACILGPGERPINIEQALWEMDIASWTDMVAELYPHCEPQNVGVDDIITIIKETNTCSNLDSPVEVWIDKEGDFRIKVYDVR